LHAFRGAGGECKAAAEFHRSCRVHAEYLPCPKMRFGTVLADFCRPQFLRRHLSCWTFYQRQGAFRVGLACQGAATPTNRSRCFLSIIAIRLLRLYRPSSRADAPEALANCSERAHRLV